MCLRILVRPCLPSLGPGESGWDLIILVQLWINIAEGKEDGLVCIWRCRLLIDHSRVLTRILRSYFTPTVLLSQPQTIWKLEYSPDWPVRGIFNFQNNHYRRNSNRNSNDTHAQKYMKTHMFFSLLQVLPRELKPQLKSNSNAFDCKTYRFCSIWVERDLGLYNI